MTKFISLAKTGRKKLTFKVIKIKSYPTNHAPLQTVFGYTDQPMLNLITCTGTYQKSKGTHDHRLSLSIRNSNNKKKLLRSILEEFF